MDEFHKLHHYVADGQIKELREALKKDPSLVNVIDARERTPLYWAIIVENEEMIIELLKWKANVNQSEFYGLTPLHAAVKKENIRIIRLLLNNGADISAKSIYDDLPIDYVEGFVFMMTIYLIDENAKKEIENIFNEYSKKR